MNSSTLPYGIDCCHILKRSDINYVMERYNYICVTKMDFISMVCHPFSYVLLKMNRKTIIGSGVRKNVFQKRLGIVSSLITNEKDLTHG